MKAYELSDLSVGMPVMWEYKVVVIERVDEDGRLDLLDGYFQTGTNFNWCCLFPITSQTLAAAKAVQGWRDTIKTNEPGNSLNWPDIHGELTRRFNEICTALPDAQAEYESLAEFANKIIHKCQDCNTEYIGDVKVFSR